MFIYQVTLETPNLTNQELLRNVLGVKERDPSDLVKTGVTEKMPWLGKHELCVKKLYNSKRCVCFFCRVSSAICVA